MDTETIYIFLGKRRRGEKWILNAALYGAVGGLVLGFLFQSSITGREQEPIRVLVSSISLMIPTMGALIITAVIISHLIGRFRGELDENPLVVHLDQSSVQFGRERIQWGDVNSISVDRRDNGIRFSMNEGENIIVRLTRSWKDNQLFWLVDHLQKRLEENAPGSPDDVPETLDALIDTPT